jgi:hypothetical protein
MTTDSGNKPSTPEWITKEIATAYRGSFQVQKSKDGTRVRFLDPSKPDNYVEVPGGAVTDLIRVLQELGPYF